MTKSFTKLSEISTLTYVDLNNRKPSEFNVNDYIVVQHEAGEKIAGQIKEKLDQLPPGEEKDKAVEQAHKELDSLKKIQGMGPEPNPNKDLPPPPPPGDNNNI